MKKSELQKIIREELNSIVTETSASVKEVSFSMQGVQPDDMMDIAIKNAVDILGVAKSESMYKPYTLERDGVYFDCSYSPYYQQDDNWRGYVNIEIDTKKFDKANVAKYLKTLKEKFKRNSNY